MEKTVTEEELLNEIVNYLKTCPGKPAIMQFLGQKYGGKRQKVSFKKFGFGGYGEFTTRWKEVLDPLLEDARLRDKVGKSIVSENELIEIIREVGLKHAQTRIRDVYGHGPFARFGYGSYEEFVLKHGLSK